MKKKISKQKLLSIGMKIFTVGAVLLVGNIYEQTFEELWEGTRRQEIIEKLHGLDINKVCREACRLDEINKYLWELRYPGEHVNFI